MNAEDEKVTLTVTMSKRAWNEMATVVDMNAEDESYGHFPGGDPRDFEPDPECSTEEERAAHKRDCEAMQAGGQALMPPTAVWERTEHGVAHYHRNAYGLGSYVIKNDDLIEARDALRAAAAAKAAGFTPRDVAFFDRACVALSAELAGRHLAQRRGGAR